MYFKKQFKRKNPTTAEQLGFYAWNAQNATDHAQHNHLKGKTLQLQSSWGSMLGMPKTKRIME